MNYLEIIFIVLHGITLLFHWISTLILNKKVKRCEKCLMPVCDSEEHNCELSSQQLMRLVDFVKSLRG